MAKKVPTVTLSNGLECPAFGLGTWLADPYEVGEVIKYAIDIGYRHIDCAYFYGNEREVGEGIRAKIADGTVKREDLFIVTKLWTAFHEFLKVVPTCKKSLEHFGLDYVDLYLIHFPVAQKLTADFDFQKPFANAVNIDYDYLMTWKGMEKCVELGLTKSIGLSNFNSKQIDRLLGIAKIKPVMNQIEVNPNLNQKKLTKFCNDRGIQITAFSPFGSALRPYAKPGDPVVSLHEPRIVAVADKHGKTAAQVILRYIRELGCIPIPKSTSKKHLLENLDIFDFKLDEDDVAILESFNCDGRTFVFEWFKGLPHYPFEGVEF